MNIEEIKQIVTAGIAALGGTAGVIALISAIAKVISTWRAGATTTEIKKIIEDRAKAELEEIKNQLKDNLNASFDVDISAKLNSTLQGLIEVAADNQAQAAVQMVALKKVMCDIAEMYAASKSITADQRAKLVEDIAAVNSVVLETKKEEKATVQINYAPVEITESVDNAVSVATKNSAKVVL